MPSSYLRVASESNRDGQLAHEKPNFESLIRFSALCMASASPHVSIV